MIGEVIMLKIVQDFGSSRKFPHFPALDTSESSPRRPVTDVAGPNFEDVPIYEDIITQEGQSDRIKEESFEDESSEDYNEESDRLFLCCSLKTVEKLV